SAAVERVVAVPQGKPPFEILRGHEANGEIVGHRSAGFGSRSDHEAILRSSHNCVIAGRDPAIHLSRAKVSAKRWMRGSSPRLTKLARVLNFEQSPPDRTNAIWSQVI